jgi:hypothetical protein
MTDRELIQMARDALVHLWDGCPADEDLILELNDRLAQPEPELPNYVDRRQWKYDPMTGRSLSNPDDVTPWEQYAFERGYFRALQVVREDQQRDFKFSTIEEAKQPVPTPVGRPQLTDDESRFADAFIALQKAGYGKEAEIVLKCKPRWQGLTDEVIWLEYQRLWPFHPAEEPTLAKDIMKFASAIEAKLKEKNA